MPDQQWRDVVVRGSSVEVVVRGSTRRVDELLSQARGGSEQFCCKRAFDAADVGASWRQQESLALRMANEMPECPG